MSTINQLIKGTRKSKPKKSQRPAFDKCPQRKGVCQKYI